MAIEDKYIDAAVVAGKLTAAAQGQGADVRQMVVTFETAAADDNGSIYRIAKALSPDLILLDAQITNDAITGGTSFDLGLYAPQDGNAVGAVVDANAFLSAGNLSSARAGGSELSAISAVDPADRVKRLFELAGHTQLTKLASYDIALTANVVGSGVGTITVILKFIQG